MNFAVIQIVLLLTLGRLNAGTDLVNPVEAFKIVHGMVDPLASLYSSMRTLIDIVLQNRTNENVKGDVDLISQTIEQLSTDITKNWIPLRRIMVYSSKSTQFFTHQRVARRNIGTILNDSSRLIKEQNQISIAVVWRIQKSLNRVMTAMKNGLLDPVNAYFIARFSLKNGIVHCDVQASNHMIYFNLMMHLVTLEVVALAAVKIHYSQNENFNGINYLISNLLYESFQGHSIFDEILPDVLDRLQFYTTFPVEMMEIMPNTIYSCYKDVEQYIELEGLIQTVFITMDGLQSCVNANNRKLISNCTKANISETRGTVSHIDERRCANDTSSVFLTLEERPCYGYLSNCSAHKRLSDVCMTKSGMKRYSSYKIDDTLYGTNDSCYNGINYSDEVSMNSSASITRCHCTCHDNDPESPPIHALSLAWSFSEIERNKVIIGVALRTFGSTITISIKQGTLIQEGSILPGSDEWKTFQALQEVKMNGKTPKYYADRLMVLDENTIFDLDDVVTGPGYVVTGIAFHEVENQRIKLKLRQTKFDWKTGALDCSMENRVMNPKSNRKELRLSTLNPSSYLNSTVPIPNPKSNKYYVRLQESSREMNGGSTTVPFFDSRSVEMEQLSPIAGIGLCHTSLSDSAGFISLRLIGLNYSNLLIGPF